jgi:hypothetical protein
MLEDEATSGRRPVLGGLVKGARRVDPIEDLALPLDPRSPAVSSP